MDNCSFADWYFKEATPEDIALYERVLSYGEFFEDMCFKVGTTSNRLIKCQSKQADGEWHDDEFDLPDKLEYFDYTLFKYKAEKPIDCDASFNRLESLLTAPINADDSIILHEMIHMHECVINELPMYFHDMLYWALYQDLKDQIPMLDSIITDHAHIVNEYSLYQQGGLHDILFLLKSFDLDIRMKYKLGTVFGYGRTDDFSEYSYRV